MARAIVFAVIGSLVLVVLVVWLGKERVKSDADFGETASLGRLWVKELPLSGKQFFTDDAGDDFAVDLDAGTISRGGIVRPIPSGNLIEALNLAAKDISQELVADER